MRKAAAIALAIACLAIVGVLALGAWRGDDRSAVDDLPSVAEVLAAQAHRHGVDLPELTDADRARLSAPPTDASSLSPYDQVLTQLVAVRDAGGVDEAVAILGEVAAQSPVIAAECSRLYEELTVRSPASRSVGDVCPR